MRSTPTGKLHADGAPGAAGTLAKGAKIVFSGKDGAKRTLYYFSTDISDGGIERSGFLAFCSGLGRGDAPLEERVLPDALRQLLEGARFRARPQRRHRRGRFRHSRCAISSPTNGSCRRSATTSGRSASSRVPISRVSRRCTPRRPPGRSTSASAITGARASRTCCWRPAAAPRPPTGAEGAQRRRLEPPLRDDVAGRRGAQRHARGVILGPVPRTHVNACSDAWTMTGRSNCLPKDALSRGFSGQARE